MTYSLVDEHGNDQDHDEEDNDEDDNDTGLALGPVLALDQLVQSILAASGKGHVDGGHCVLGSVVEMLDMGILEL
ncbi:hypothetical protein J1614_012086 [Plenodomus biglobosus]|nr:hypothetical protein J1614_012086 [Plenodomus biglobosus]